MKMFRRKNIERLYLQIFILFVVFSNSKTIIIKGKAANVEVSCYRPVEGIIVLVPIAVLPCKSSCSIRLG